MRKPVRPIQPAKQFAIILIVFMIVFAFSIVALNYLANPYRLFNTFDPLVLDAKKPRPEKYQQQIRTAVAKNIPSDVLILGNSTLEIGINPDDPMLAPIGLSFYNHAIAGHNLHDVSLGLDEILKVWKPKYVLINASLADFIHSAEIEKKRLTAIAEGDLRVKALFSIDTVLDSLRSLLINFQPNIQTITARGHNPMNVAELGAKRTGYKQLFDVAESRIMQMMLNYQGGKGVSPIERSTSISDYSSLVKKLVDSNIKVIVIISPLHKSYQQGLRKFNLLETQFQWKIALVQATQNLNKSENIRLLDFGCADKWLSETIPTRTDRNTIMANYWDSEHFKANVGTEIIREIFTAQAGNNSDLNPKQGFDLLKYGVQSQTAKCEKISR
jgi:hypothetical protein